MEHDDDLVILSTLSLMMTMWYKGCLTVKRPFGWRQPPSIKTQWTISLHLHFFFQIPSSFAWIGLIHVQVLAFSGFPIFQKNRCKVWRHICVIMSRSGGRQVSMDHRQVSSVLEHFQLEYKLGLSKLSSPCNQLT